MARDRKPRTWVKLDCHGVLDGSMNYLLSLDLQAIWIKMIAYSEICGGRAGYIEDNNKGGLPLDYLAHKLNCNREQLDSVLEIMGRDGAVKMNGTGSIHLVNFAHYQFSEYDRQKPYRLKLDDKDGPQSFDDYVVAIKPNYSDLDVDVELEKFKLYWSEGGRELKRPKLALRNWLDKAREIKNTRNNGQHTTGRRPRSLPRQYT